MIIGPDGTRSRYRQLSLRLMGACLLATGACAGSAIDLRPTQIAADQGAVIGRIVVRYDDAEITPNCYAHFTDAGSAERADVRLERDGWIFSAFERGSTRLAQVRCSVSNRSTAIMSLDHRFDVPGGKVAGYFGHLTFDLDSQTSFSHVTNILVNGAPSGARILSGFFAPRTGGALRLDTRPDYAAREYAARYGPNTGLRIASGAPLDVGAHSPENLVYEALNLDGIKLEWIGLPHVQPDKVELRLGRVVKALQWQECHELTLQIDGHRTAFAVAPLAQREAAGTTESVRGQVELSAMEALATSQRAELDLCGSTRTLTASVRTQAHAFVRRFKVLARSAGR